MKNTKALKKKRLVLLLAFALALLAAAFALKDFPGPEKIPGINVYIKEGTVSPTGLCLVVENKGDQVFCFGEEFHILKRGFLSWDLIWPFYVNVMFRQYAIVLEPGESYEIEQTWDDYYGGLPKGRYLLVKSGDLRDDADDMQRQQCSLEIVFDIE